MNGRKGQQNLPVALRGFSEEPVARAAIRIACAAAISALAWAHFTALPEIAYAEGRLEPKTALQRIEHPDEGIVAQIPVDEGQVLGANALVLRLSDRDIAAEAQALATRATALERTLDRTRQMLALIGAVPTRPALGRSGDSVVAARLAAYGARLQRLMSRVSSRADAIRASGALVRNLAEREEVAREDASRFEKLAERASVTAIQVSERRQQLLEVTGAWLRAEEALAAANSALVDAREALMEFHEQAREGLLAEFTEAEDSLGLVREAQGANALRRDRLTVTMPRAGVIPTLHVTTVGEVVDAGGLLAEFLPADEELLASVQLRPIDAGHVAVGDPVDLRLTTFEAKRFGTLKGVVEHISATSVRNEAGEYLFKVLVRLERQTIGKGEDLRRLCPGIEVSASIVTDSRRVLAYAASPVLTPFRRAFGER